MFSSGYKTQNGGLSKADMERCWNGKFFTRFAASLATLNIYNFSHAFEDTQKSAVPNIPGLHSFEIERSKSCYGHDGPEIDGESPSGNGPLRAVFTFLV